MSNCCEELKREISELRTVINSLQSTLDSRYVRRNELSSLTSRFVDRQSFNAAIAQLRNRISSLEACTGCVSGGSGGTGGTGSGGSGGTGSGGSGGNRSGDNQLIEKVFRDRRWIAATEVLTFIIKGKV